jgi:hypothetical protein
VYEYPLTKTRVPLGAGQNKRGVNSWAALSVTHKLQIINAKTNFILQIIPCGFRWRGSCEPDLSQGHGGGNSHG